MEVKMYKIQNDSKRKTLHVAERFKAVMPGETVEVEKLPDNMSFWKVISQPEIKVIEQETKVKIRKGGK